MDTKEQKSKKYKILPVKIDKKKHPKWADVDEMLPIHPFSIVCSAPCKSGKSVWLANMIMNPKFDWLNRFDRIIWISPTVFTDKSVAPIHKVIDPEIEDNPYADKVKLFDDIDSIDLIIKTTLEDQKENPEIMTLLILDDCLGAMRSGTLGKVFCKYRHYNLSVFCASQAFRMFCPVTRGNASGYVLWKTFNTKEKEKILEELSSIENIEQMYNDVTSRKYSFLWCNIDQMAVYDNFDTCLWKK